MAISEETVIASDVLENPEKYNGRVLTITGFISIEFENVTIKRNKKLKYGECIWITFDVGPYDTEEDMERYKKRDLHMKNKYDQKITSIKGYFTSGRSGHFGICSGALNVIKYEFDKTT